MGLGVELQWIGQKGERHAFPQAIDAASPLMAMRFRRPSWFWKMQRWMDVGAERELGEKMRTVYAWLQGLIDKSLATIDGAGTTEADTKTVVELFAERSGEDMDGLRAEDLADFLLTFVVAARDTTAQTLSWLFYAISQHPSVEERVRKEMKDTLGHRHGQSDTMLTNDEIKQLLYLEATIRETLRLYPAAPATVKQVKRDTIICGDIPLKKGQLCILHAYAMARNPLVWGEDAADFKPERWIDDKTQEIRQFLLPSSSHSTRDHGPASA